MPLSPPQFNPRFNSADLSGSDDEQLTEVIARCKRRIVELESQLDKANGVNPPPARRAFCFVFSLRDLSSRQEIVRGPRARHLQSRLDLRFCRKPSLITEDDRRRDLEDARTSGDDVHEEEPEPNMEFVPLPSFES